jgi:hypothetical protein
VGSRSTSYQTFQLRSWSGGASNNFATHAENSDSLVLVQLFLTCQMAPAGMLKGAGFFAATAISRVTGLQLADVALLSSVARQLPAAGVATSANQA